MKGYSVDTVEVNFESLQSGGDGIAGVYRSLVGTLENLESSLHPMLNTWSGEARSAYFAQKKQWDEAAQALGTILAQIGQAVHGAHDNYRSAEKHNQSLWNG
jgi:early secretory antigenic target protein ESAT-6